MHLRAQLIEQAPNTHSQYNGIQLNEVDLLQLSNIPEFPMPESYKHGKGPLLPSSVDNSVQPYFRPIIYQSGYECGQMASIAFNFTYEMAFRRTLSANIAANQYPTHFAWNFMNNAYNYQGVSAFDTWEILRHCGTPNVVDYGGSLNFGGFRRWISGYSAYYNGMKNRINDFYAIRCDAPEGIEKMKHYLNDHLEDLSIGGLLNFYGQYFTPTEVLAAGTPEAGKAFASSWGGSPSHTWVMVGYNDSIRWDYNNDGLFTNNIDINGDGIVDVKDWEIGAFKFANIYAGTSWGNSGFCYSSYRVLAVGIAYGGIWNQCVYLNKVKKEFSPQLTMKVNLKHSSRNKIKVIAGIALNTAALLPEKTMEFPIFNNQGSFLYMQGDSIEANKTIEFGLDVTPLLSYINSGQSAKYFLQVIDTDPNNEGTGEVQHLTLIDYTSGVDSSVSASTFVPIVNNSTTTLSVIRTVNFSKPIISTDTLAVAKLMEPYSAQLTAINGTPPYRFELNKTYAESNSLTAFPQINTETLVPSSYDNGYCIKTIDFDFPFYGKTFTNIYVYADGFIKFDNLLYTWPFLTDKYALFKNTAFISPMFCDYVATPSSGEGIWYEGNSTHASFRWKAHQNGTSNPINVVITIYPNGNIEFSYGSITLVNTTSWFAGISGGDGRNWQYLSNSGSYLTNITEKKFTLTAPNYPPGLAMSEEGLLSGTPTIEMTNFPLSFKVTDNSNIVNTKNFNFSTKGIIISNYSIQAGGDTIVDAGDTVLLSVTLKNVSLTTANNVSMSLSDTLTSILMLDSLQAVGNIAAGASINLVNAFKFVVDSSVVDGSFIYLLSKIIDPVDTFNSSIKLRVNTQRLKLGNITVADGNNGILEPAETSALIAIIENVGGSAAINVEAKITTWDPYVTILSNTANIPTIPSNSNRSAFFLIEAAANAPLGHLVIFDMHVTTSNGFARTFYICLTIGELAEKFETADFSLYPWQQGGIAPWHIYDTIPQEGLHCAQSGLITHNEESSMFITLNVLNDGNISFYRKVSCEADNTNHNYDYLSFSIDGLEMNRWDGQTGWDKYTYNVDAGLRTFKWLYHKDLSVSNNYDCAWIDYILLPTFGNPGLNINEIENSKTELLQNIPNPFNGETVIGFNLSENAKVNLEIYNLNGEKLNTLLSQTLTKGSHTLSWDGTDSRGNHLADGIYYYRLNAGKFTATKKLIRIGN